MKKCIDYKKVGLAVFISTLLLIVFMCLICAIIPFYCYLNDLEKGVIAEISTDYFVDSIEVIFLTLALTSLAAKLMKVFNLTFKE